MIKWQNVKQHCNLSHPLGLDCIGKIRDYILEKYVFLGALF